MLRDTGADRTIRYGRLSTKPSSTMVVLILLLVLPLAPRFSGKCLHRTRPRDSPLSSRCLHKTCSRDSLLSRLNNVIRGQSPQQPISNTSQGQSPQFQTQFQNGFDYAPARLASCPPVQQQVPAQNEFQGQSPQQPMNNTFQRQSPQQPMSNVIRGQPPRQPTNNTFQRQFPQQQVSAQNAFQGQSPRQQVPVKNEFQGQSPQQPVSNVFRGGFSQQQPAENPPQLDHLWDLREQHALEPYQRQLLRTPRFNEVLRQHGFAGPGQITGTMVEGGFNPPHNPPPPTSANGVPIHGPANPHGGMSFDGLLLPEPRPVVNAADEPVQAGNTPVQHATHPMGPGQQNSHGNRAQ